MDTYTLQTILWMVLCVLGSAFFSASETAFSVMNKTRIKTMAEHGDKKAELAVKLSEQYDKLISTVLIGNNLVNILLTAIATIFFVRKFGDAGATISTAVITLVVLIFGEISPKTIAKNYPESFAKFSAPILKFLMVLFSPLNFLFGQWQKLLTKLFPGDSDDKMSQEELLMLVDEVQEEGAIDDGEVNLLRNAIEFGDMKAEDILTHRVDVEAVSIDEETAEVAKLFSKTGFSRLPVFEDTIDNIIGVVHQKDLYEDGQLTKKPLRELLSPVLFTHPSEKLDDLLKLLQAKKTHIAVVLDEYGGTLGIVTMEDILEELVGEIWDEHDEVEEEFRRLSETAWLVEGSANFEDFCQLFDLDEPETDSVSVGGWVTEQLDKIPAKGDHFQYENLHITVTETDGHRVLYLRVNVKQEKHKDRQHDKDEKKENQKEHKNGEHKAGEEQE